MITLALLAAAAVALGRRAGAAAERVPRVDPVPYQRWCECDEPWLPSAFLCVAMGRIFCRRCGEDVRPLEDSDDAPIAMPIPGDGMRLRG